MAAHQAPPSLGFSRQERGVGCHFLLQCMKVKSESGVAQSCLTLRDPKDSSLPASSIHRIFQARVLEWGHCLLRLHGTTKAKSHQIFDLSLWLLNSSKTVTNKSYASLERNPNIYGQLTFDKQAKTIPWRKRRVFSKNGSGTTGFPTWKRRK